MGRQPNGRSSIYLGADGLWHTWVHVGRKPNGKPDRKHIKRATATEVAKVADELRERISRGTGVPTKIETLEQWLTHWLAHIVKPGLAYKTYVDYRSLSTVWIIPYLGQWKLTGTRNRLEPEHIDALYARMREAKLSPSYILRTHRVLRKALKDAMRRGRAARNVCDLLDPPRARARRIDAHSLEDAQKILGAAMEDARAARWLIGLLLGLRQGEVLGLRWPKLRLDSTAPYLIVQKQLQRRTWEHGCKDPAACAKPRCRTAPCPPRYEHGCAQLPCGKQLAYACPARHQAAGCSRHTRPCPPMCRPDCMRHASRCPNRREGGLVEVDVKSEKGEREVPLPAAIVEQLRLVREAQIRAAASRGQDWDPQGLVFVGEQGRPLDPRADHAAWERLLQRAGVDDSRLHAARHTAGTFMVGSGTDIRVVQEILGHSRIAVTEAYVDVAADIKRQAVDRIAATLMDGQLSALLQGPKVPGQRPGE